MISYCLLLPVLAVSAAVAPIQRTAQVEREAAVPAVGLTAPVPTALEPAAKKFAAGEYEEARRLAYQVLANPESDAQAGQAETLIGHCFYHGFGCEKDMESAAVFYGKAAERGNPAAQFQLSALHLTGQFPPVSSLEDGFNLLHRSADSGWPPAQTRVAAELLERKDPPPTEADQAEALRLLTAAAEGGRFPGDPEAQIMLAGMKLEGRPGLELSDEKAFELLAKAAAAGRPDAQHMLFNVEMRGLLGRQANQNQAWFWLRTLKYDPLARGLFLGAYREYAAVYGPPEDKKLADRIEAEARAFRLRSRGAAPYLPIDEGPDCGDCHSD